MPSANSSLQRRLPIWVVVILLIAVGTFGALAYWMAWRATENADWVRVRAVADRFSQTSAAGLRDRVALAQAVAQDPRVLNFVRSGRDSTAARTALARLGVDTGLHVASGIRRLDGSPLLAMRNPLPLAPVIPPSLTDSSHVGPLFRNEIRANFEVVAPIQVEGKTVAHVVSVRAVFSPQTTLNTVRSLVGPSGNLLVGNADGSEWSDFRRALGPKPFRVGDNEYPADSGKRLLSAAPVPGTPFLIAATVAANSAGGALQGFLWTLVLTGLAVVGAGALAGWYIIRQVTNPLVHLTAAAEAIASGGKASLSVGDVRNDEIGRLTQAFATMSGRVTAARENLEHLVSERTAELHRAQKELIQRERLAVLGELASSVGHELRNPLGVMSNVAYYLDAALTDVPPKAREHLHTLRRQIGIAEKIVTDILDFTRVRTPEKTVVAVEPFVESQLERVTVPAAVRVECTMDDDVPAILADPFQVGQVLHNVLTNAVQAMEPNGGVLRVRAYRNNGRVCIDVIDEGPGVPMEHREQVFEPLFTTKLRGIGLGLSVSRTLAHANGGLLHIAQSSPQGTTFRLELPAAEPEP